MTLNHPHHQHRPDFHGPAAGTRVSAHQLGAPQHKGGRGEALSPIGFVGQWKGRHIRNRRSRTVQRLVPHTQS